MALSSNFHAIFATSSKLPASQSSLTTTTLHLSTKPVKSNSYNLFSRTSSANSDHEKWRVNISFFPAFLNKGKDVKLLKEELLDAIAPLDRGADATPEDQQRVDQVGFLFFSFHFLPLILILLLNCKPNLHRPYF